jgi:hypothetical protein
MSDATTFDLDSDFGWGGLDAGKLKDKLAKVDDAIVDGKMQSGNVSLDAVVYGGGCTRKFPIGCPATDRTAVYAQILVESCSGGVRQGRFGYRVGVTETPMTSLVTITDSGQIDEFLAAAIPADAIVYFEVVVAATGIINCNGILVTTEA